jgi:hypothetical protein
VFGNSAKSVLLGHRHRLPGDDRQAIHSMEKVRRSGAGAVALVGGWPCRRWDWARWRSVCGRTVRTLAAARMVPVLVYKASKSAICLFFLLGRYPATDFNDDKDRSAAYSGWLMAHLDWAAAGINDPASCWAAGVRAGRRDPWPSSRGRSLNDPARRCSVCARLTGSTGHC